MVPTDPHCPAHGMDHGRWDAGSPTWEHLPREGPTGESGLSVLLSARSRREESTPTTGWDLSPHLSHGTLAGFAEEHHLLQRVIDGGMRLVSISATSVRGKASLYVKNHYKQKVKREKSPFPLNKEN